MMFFSQQLVRALVHPDIPLRKRRGHEERRLPPGDGRERVRAGQAANCFDDGGSLGGGVGEG
jgi:hypothetical protein